MLSVPSPHRSRIGRLELGAPPADRAMVGELVGTLCHLSDLHLLDPASPMRFEWIETLAHDPRWRPLLHMHRPQEALVPWAVAAHVELLRANPAPGTRAAPIDLVLCTGDNIDNAQRNELDAYLGLLAGGTVSLPAIGGPHDAADHVGPEPWPYWSPLPHVTDVWKPLGYPSVADFFERVAEPITSSGVGMPWTSLPGNHDLLCQGTALVDELLVAAAIGSEKGLFPIDGFAPDDALSLFVDAPARFLAQTSRQVRPDPLRRPVDLGEWIAEHARRGAAGWDRSTSTSADTVVDLGRLTVVILDTNHPAGDYQGSVGAAQLDWLDEQLTRADELDQLVVLASHHGAASLVNRRGDDPTRRHADALLDVVHRHACVVAWLVGHRHHHRITAHPGPAGGFYEITTASLIDWPVERRLVEVIRHDDLELVEIVCTVDAHGAPAGSLAALHRDLAQRFGGSQVRSSMAGAEDDRDVRLYLDRRRRR
jgi:metallophosphoesterase (TIGR03767 family)